MADTIAGLSTSRLERISELIEGGYVAPEKIAGAQVLVARRGQIAYHRSFGLMDRERDRPWTDDTLVRIYSMTKPIVSVALMMLWERGLFQLDEPVAKWLPEWADQRVWVSGEGESMVTELLERPVTFRHLLSHTAGLTYGSLLETLGIGGQVHPVDQVYKALKVRREATEDLDAFVAKLGRVPLRYQPGRQWMYSFATDVVGALVQRISDRPLDRFLEEEIIRPLKMVDTGFHVRPDQRARFAACYQRQPDRTAALQDDPETSAYLKPPVFLSGGGGLVSTMADYHRFCEMLRRGGELDGVRLIGPRTLKLMAANHLPGGASLAELALDSFSETTPVGVGFGLGFAVTVDGVRAGTPSQGDYYWGGAASTIFWVDPKEDLVAILLTQLLPSTTFNFRGQLKSLVYAALED
jgi:CubicO group peptidase (beta-lactamase class C family)